MRGIILKESYDFGDMWMGRGPHRFANPSLLRFCLCYWDIVDYPKQYRLQDSLADVAAYIERSEVKTTEEKFFKRANDTCYKAFIERERQAPGQWSICGAIEPSETNRIDLVENRGAYIRLMRCLPVPSQDVPFDRILEFKRRHDSERLALLDAIDDLYLQAIQSPDRAMSFSSALGRLQRAVEAEIEAARKSNSNFELWDLEVRFNIPASLAVGATLFMETGSLPLTIFGSVLTAHFGPTFSFNSRIGDRLTPYAYIGKMSTRLEW